MSPYYVRYLSEDQCWAVFYKDSQVFSNKHKEVCVDFAGLMIWFHNMTHEGGYKS